MRRRSSPLEELLERAPPVTLACRQGAKAYGLIAVLLLFGLMGFFPGWGQSFDYSVAPGPKDNFLEASFRLAVPPGSAPISRVLVYIPGTDGDGRGVIDDPRFLALGQACHAAILGCCYRGEGLSYQDPRGGSGRALDEALAYFASKTGDPQVLRAKLLLVGFSQGGMFTFNYVCWRPERVKAFAALRAIFPCMEPGDEAFQAPGLLAAGEKDEAGRNRSIAEAFLKAKGHDGKWALLLEHSSGHEIGESLKLAGSLFAAVCREGPVPTPVYLNLQGKEAGATELDNRCYFPDLKVADLWKSLHRPISLHALLTLSDRSRLQDLVSVEGPDIPFSCGKGESESGLMRISSRVPGLVINSVKIEGAGFQIRNPIGGQLPIEVEVSFSPKNLPWGRAKADMAISGSLNGKAVEDFDTTLSGLVSGPVTPMPSFVYLGAVPIGRKGQCDILLKVNFPGVHVADFKLPHGISAFVGLPDRKGDLPLHIVWSPSNRLGRMEGQIEVAFDAPQNGVLRIPVVGLVALYSPR